MSLILFTASVFHWSNVEIRTYLAGFNTETPCALQSLQLLEPRNSGLN